MARQQEVRIPITAADQASQVFRKVAQEADAMKKRIEAANKATALKADWLHSGSQVKQARRSSRPASSSSKDAARGAEELSSSASSLSNVLSSGKLIAAAWGTSIFLAGKQALDAAVMVDRLNKAYTTIEGSQMGAQMQLDFMYQKTHELGLQFYDTAEASKNFFAAMRGTAIEGDANKIWEAVTKAGAALSLSSDDMESIFRSLGQMVSKGKVMAEELRGQLGERLPGAFQLAAKAMGVTTMELDKMLETGDVLADDLLPKLAVEIEKAFGAGAQQAAQGLQQNINRLSTEWEKFKASILNSEIVAQSLRRISNAMKAINDSRYEEERRRLAEPEMRKAGIKPEAGEWAPTGEYFVPAYSDRQYEEWFKKQEELTRGSNALAEGAQSAEAKLAKSTATISKYLKYTWASQRKEAEDNYKAVQEAIDEKIALYKKEGTDYSYLLEQKKQADAEYRRQLDELEKKHTKKTDYRGPETIDRDYAGEAIAELRKKAEGQEKKDFKQETRDLDMVADVMQELAEKTGQYGLAVESVNELIDRQGELWLKAGVPQNYVDQLKEVRRLEASREGWAGAMLATRQYYSEATNMAEAYKGVVTNAFGGMEDAIVNACMTGKLSFTDMVNSMIADLMRLMVRQSITGPLADALGQGIAGLFAGNQYGGAYASGVVQTVPRGALYGPSALGNVFSGAGSLHSYSNSIVSRPTMFTAASRLPQYASGAGLMGEAGPEAIMPLARMGNGRLGVEARGWGGKEPTVNVNIVNSTGQQATTRTRSDNHGNKTIDVYVGDMAAQQMATPGTTLNRAVSAQTGTRRPAIRR